MGETTDRDRLEDLARLVVATRAAQRRYFADRTPEALAASKRAERDLDRAAAGVLEPADPQRRLF